MDLEYFKTSYESIIKSNLSINKRDRKLAKLMTEMEQFYKIPMLRSTEWEEANTDVIELYGKVSLSRRL